MSLKKVRTSKCLIIERWKVFTEEEEEMVERVGGSRKRIGSISVEDEEAEGREGP